MRIALPYGSSENKRFDIGLYNSLKKRKGVTDIASRKPKKKTVNAMIWK